MSSTFKEHMLLVQKVLKTLANYNMKIKVKKCEFFRDSISFLGHVMSRTGIRKSPDYIKKVREYSPPTTVTEMRRFLGLVNFQRKFIPFCSEISKPLSCLLYTSDAADE